MEDTRTIREWMDGKEPDTIERDGITLVWDGEVWWATETEDYRKAMDKHLTIRSIYRDDDGTEWSDPWPVSAYAYNELCQECPALPADDSRVAALCGDEGINMSRFYG